MCCGLWFNIKMEKDPPLLVGLVVVVELPWANYQSMSSRLLPLSLRGRKPPSIVVRMPLITKPKPKREAAKQPAAYQWRSLQIPEVQ